MKKYIPLFIFLIVFLGANLFKVITDVRPFYDWDESIYAQVGKEMMQSKSYLVPLWQGRAWLDKPPIPSLMYGLMTYIPVQNEISMRVLTVLLSGVALALLYIFTLRNSKSLFVSLLTVIITSFLPAFLQRTQGLNVDVFLLIGWLGYVLWYRNLWVGMFFLTFAVLSKSLLGYYPVAMVFFYELFQWYFNQKKGKKEFCIFIKNTLIQTGFSSLWFFWMYFQYRNDFIQYHIIDSHFKRVTASIEQHFGQRTFYIDLLIEQFRYSIIPILISIFLLSYTIIKHKSKEAYFSLIFVPWFIFLNLTKTKIAWYLYPVLPQFVYLAIYGLVYIKKQWISGVVFIAILLYLGISVFPPLSYLQTNNSKWEDHQLIAEDAKKAGCKDFIVLVNKDTRTSYATLKSMDLVIHTTQWWGNHPSMAYYSEAKTLFIYSLQQFRDTARLAVPQVCFAAEKEDLINLLGLSIISKNKTFVLGVKK